MSETSIEWTDRTWNPTRGCSMAKGSEAGGCLNCYAALMASRNLPEMRSPTNGKPYARRTASGPRWTGHVELIPSKLDEPLRWRDARPTLGRPLRIFVDSMSDLFHEALDFHDIAAVYGVMAYSPHTFQVLTKRPERRLAFMRWMTALVGSDITGGFSGVTSLATDPVFGAELAAGNRGVKFGPRKPGKPPWPLPNVWEGTSCEDQRTADERIPLLLQTPAAVRFVSLEPLLGPIDFRDGPLDPENSTMGEWSNLDGLGWVIVGGESGPGARPCDISWIRSILRQCREAGVACFIKQLGSIAHEADHDGCHPGKWKGCPHVALTGGACDCCGRVPLKHPKGGDPDEWPNDLRVREFPG